MPTSSITASTERRLIKSSPFDGVQFMDWASTLILPAALVDPFCDFPNQPTRIPGSEHAVRDVPRDDASGPDYRLRADIHARANDRPAADPHIRADLDGLAELLLPTQFGVHWVRGRVDLHRRPEQREVANLDHAHVEDNAVEVEENPLAKVDVGTVVAEERRLHPNRIPTFAEEFD
jgi:hypothetical protein